MPVQNVISLFFYLGVSEANESPEIKEAPAK